MRGRCITQEPNRVHVQNISNGLKAAATEIRLSLRHDGGRRGYSVIALPARKCDGHVERFILICAPKIPEGSSFVRPLSQPGFFYESLNRPELGSSLVHPLVASAPSFPIWQAEVGGEEQLLVPDRRLQNVFQSPGRNHGLLFLAQPSPSALRLTFEGARYHYGPTDPEEFGLRRSLFFERSGSDVAHRVLREKRSISHELRRAAVAVGTLQSTPDGWMNPLVLRVELDGDVCSQPAQGAAQNDPRVVFQQLLRETRILAILPEFEPNDDARFFAWKEFCAALNPESTALESLLFGGGALGGGGHEAEERLRTFLGLDALGGEFALEGHGGPPTEPLGITYSWHAPKSATGNRRWLGEQLARRWRNGHSLVRPDWSNSPPAESRAGITYRVGGGQERGDAHVIGKEVVLTFPGRTFAPAPNRLSREEMDRATSSVQGFLDAIVRLGVSAPDEPLFRYFARVLDCLAQNEISLHEQIHRRWFQRLGNDRLALDVGGFFEDLARTIAVPRSRVLIRLPNPEGLEQPIYVSVLEAVPFGARSFLWGLLLERDQRPDVRTIPLRMGWWNAWHTTLFNAPATIRIKFERTCFSLGTAALGRVALGGVEPTPHTTKPTIRFSVPY